MIAGIGAARPTFREWRSWTRTFSNSPIRRGHRPSRSVAEKLNAEPDRRALSSQEEPKSETRAQGPKGVVVGGVVALHVALAERNNRGGTDGAQL